MLSTEPLAPFGGSKKKTEETLKKPMFPGDANKGRDRREEGFLQEKDPHEPLTEVRGWEWMWAEALLYIDGFQLLART